jgi:hypothetical protein
MLSIHVDVFTNLCEYPSYLEEIFWSDTPWNSITSSVLVPDKSLFLSYFSDSHVTRPPLV